MEAMVALPSSCTFCWQFCMVNGGNYSMNDFVLWINRPAE